MIFICSLFLFFLCYNHVSIKFVVSDCPHTAAVQEDRRPDTSSLRIVQYNVEWLFNDYYKAANCPGSGCPWKNTTEAETHLQYVSKIIKELNPDIINFCEVEGCDELQLVIDTLADNTYNPYLIQGTDTSTGQNVGMLTRIDPIKDLYRTEARYDYPIPGSTCSVGGSSGSSGVSKHYITEFNINGLHIAFIAAHLLAYPTDEDRCLAREAQAQVLQQVIWGYASKGYEIIVMGDFNDFDKEVVDANNNKPISQVLDILKGVSGDYADTYQLFSVAQAIPQIDRFSDWWDENENCVSSVQEFSMIDHVLTTKAIQDKIVISYIYHNYDEFCGTYNSDHYPIVIDLNMYM